MNELTAAIQAYVEKEIEHRVFFHTVAAHWDGDGSVNAECKAAEQALAELDAAVTKAMIAGIL